MNDLIYDAYSIFFQILQFFAPEHIGDIEFLLIGYTFACTFLLIIVYAIVQIFVAFTRAVLCWFYRFTDWR